MYDVIIKNASIPQGDRTHKTNILIQDEKVAGFMDSLDGIEGNRKGDRFIFCLSSAAQDHAIQSDVPTFRKSLTGYKSPSLSRLSDQLPLLLRHGFPEPSPILFRSLICCLAKAHIERIEIQGTGSVE